MKKWKLFTALFLFLVLTQVFIFGISRENWFDVSFTLETAHIMNTVGIHWYEFAEIILFVWVVALSISWLVWRRIDAND